MLELELTESCLMDDPESSIKLMHDKQDAAIASTIITMARNLGLKMLAEGVG
ncbi:MAG: hypothetical protein Q9M20_08025 [Mariprofundaceae bacterium]|nr:hypothetical protein [Mariprofundaceae bacterium]